MRDWLDGFDMVAKDDDLSFWVMSSLTCLGIVAVLVNHLEVGVGEIEFRSEEFAGSLQG